MNVNTATHTHATDTTRILALDLSAICGFAAGTRDAMITGSVRLTGRTATTSSTERLLALLDELHRAITFDVIRVRANKRRKGAPIHSYVNYTKTVAGWAKERGLACDSIASGMVKKSFTGHGNASGDAIVGECLRHNFVPQNEREAMAFALYDTTLRELYPEDVEDQS
jgi:hypothetical protein